MSQQIFSVSKAPADIQGSGFRVESLGALSMIMKMTVNIAIPKRIKLNARTVSVT